MTQLIALVPLFKYIKTDRVVLGDQFRIVSTVHISQQQIEDCDTFRLLWKIQRSNFPGFRGRDFIWNEFYGWC